MKNLYIVLAHGPAGQLPAQINHVPDQLLRVPYQSTAMKVERDFFVYLPAGYEESEKDFPVLLFLHGNGERGDGKAELD